MNLAVRKKSDPDKWITLGFSDGYWEPTADCFEDFDFKIDGIVYTELTDEFVKALQASAIWQELGK